jgi:hypothetical protein
MKDRHLLDESNLKRERKMDKRILEIKSIPRLLETQQLSDIRRQN